MDWIFKAKRRLVYIVLGLAVSGFLYDFCRFTAVYRDYAEKAQAPNLPTTVFSDETIVVLTGDRYRIPKALELLRKRKSPHLIISGAGRGITLTDLVNQQRDATIDIHSTWKKIAVESRSQSTIENAEETARFVREWRTKHLILVTSDYHMQRSSLIFRKVFPTLRFYEYPVHSELSLGSTVLSKHMLNGVSNLWVEYWKLLLYRLYFAKQILPAKIPF